MPVHILSRTRHRDIRWKSADSFSFAASRNTVGVGLGEVSRASLSYPLAFIPQNDSWALYALTGLGAGQNLYVDADGRWLGSHVPAILRGHPFHLGWEGSQAVLCIDEDSGLLSEDHGELIFESGGELSGPVSGIWSFLTEAAAGIIALEKCCGALASAEVLEPWPINVRDSSGTHVLSSLYRVSEVALNNLNDTAFGQLRRFGAIGIAYAQLLSMGNLSQVALLAQARGSVNASLDANATRTSMISLPDDSTIDWDWSKIGK